jgi:hypothetical protein
MLEFILFLGKRSEIFFVVILRRGNEITLRALAHTPKERNISHPSDDKYAPAKQA